jgi:uncharacterized membrane protein YhfC
MGINYALLATYIGAILIEIGLPICLAVYLIKKYPQSWIMIVAGVFTFAIAQLIQIPAISGLQTLFSSGRIPTPASAAIPFVNAGVVGLLAAVVEEGLRWIAFKLTEKYGKPFRSGISLGVGHGGSELLIVGALVAYNLGTVLFYNPGHQIAKGVSMATVQTVLSQIASYWQSTWYVSAMGVFEKLVQFSAQLVFSIFMWKAVLRDSPVWFFAALVYHTIIAGITTLLSGLGWGYWQVEGILALFLLLNILIIYSLWGDEGGLESEGDEDEEDDEDDEEEDDAEDEEDDEDEVEEEEEIKPKPLRAKKTATK